MNEVVTFLNENPVQYLATVGRDGKAKCRPFMFAGEMDSRLWFCTNNQKEVYKDMQDVYKRQIISSTAQNSRLIFRFTSIFITHPALLYSTYSPSDGQSRCFADWQGRPRFSCARCV